jgi:hypothetical protein
MLYLLEVDGIVAAAAAGFVLGVSGLVFLTVLAWRGAKILAGALTAFWGTGVHTRPPNA